MRDHIAVKFRAYPTGEQARLIDRTMGCARLVYNLMLETRIAHWQTTWESCHPTPAIFKDACPFLREVDSYALCNAQRDLEQAYTRYFKDKNAGIRNTSRNITAGRRIRPTCPTTTSAWTIRRDD